MKKLSIISVFLLFFIITSNGQWTYENLSEPRSHMGAAVLGTKAYFAGGRNGDTLLSTVEIYDTKSGLWSDTNLSVARMLPAGVACGSKVLFAGGIDLTGSPYTAYAEVDIFDTITQQWTVDSLSVARMGVAAVSYENTVLFAGGGTAVPWANYDIVDIYDIETGEWTTATLSEARDARAAAVVGDLALFGGGYNNGSISNTVDIYNFTTGSWSVDTLSVPRDRLQAVTIDNKVLFAGGMTADNVGSDVVDIYDASTGTWSIDTLSFPRAFSNNTCGAKACGNKAFFAGGGYLDINTLYWQQVFDNIDIYDEVSNSWTVDNMSIARIEHVVAGVGNQLVVAGGLNSSWQQISSVEIFTCPPSSCLPDGITFSTQAEIDSFQINYPGCTEIEGDVTIGSWPNSTISNLNGLSVLTHVGGDLYIGGNDSITSLIGLENLNFLDGSLSIGFLLAEYFMGNASLTSLMGLENLGFIGGDLKVSYNESLSICEVEGVCDYLINPNGDIIIENNATGCNSQEDVEEACLIDNIGEFVPAVLTLHPNPTNKSSITITLGNRHNLDLTCFNTFGQQVHQQQISSSETLINVSTWSPGIYLAVVYEDGKTVGRSKFVVQ